MNKLSKILSKTIFIFTLIFFCVILFNTLMYTKNVMRYDSRMDLWLYILMGVILYLIFIQIIKLLQKKELFRYSYIWILIGCLILVLQCIYAYSIKMVPIWDSRNIINEAARMLNDKIPQISSVNGYFEMYGNNYPIVIFLYYYYKILSILHIKHFWAASIILNIFLIDISIALFCYLLKTVKNSKWAFNFLLFSLLNPYTYVYVTFVYTTTFSMAAIAITMLLIYCLYQAFQNKSSKKYILYSVFLGSVSFFFFKLRATNFIVILAFFIVSFIYLCDKNHKTCYIDKKVKVVFLLLILLGWGSTSILYNKIEAHYVNKAMSEHNFPITHWIMMSNMNGGRGMYSEEDERKTASYKSYEDKVEMNLHELVNRLQSFSGEEFLIHIKDKLSINWSEGVTYIQELMHCNQTYGEVYSFFAGKNSSLFSVYYQVYLCGVYFLGIFGTIKNILYNRIDYLYLLTILTLLGAFLFYLVWEVSPCYNICFMPLFVLVAVYGNMSEEINTFSNKNLQLFPVILGAGMLIFTYSAESNGKISYDNYSISSIYRRPLLEQQFTGINEENKILVQTFHIRKSKFFNRISILVNTLEEYKTQDNLNTNYLFKLYDSNGKLLYQTDIESSEEVSGEYYCTIQLPTVLKNGDYKFTIENHGTVDSLEFIYTKQEIIDNNPDGFLEINGNSEQRKCDLIFNVYYEQ